MLATLVTISEYAAQLASFLNVDAKGSPRYLPSTFPPLATYMRQSQYGLGQEVCGIGIGHTARTFGYWILTRGGCRNMPRLPLNYHFGLRGRSESVIVARAVL